MDAEYIRFVRARLKRRFKRLKNVERIAFHSKLVQTFDFLRDNEIAQTVLTNLETRFPHIRISDDEVMLEEARYGRTESEQAAICLAVLKTCVNWTRFQEINYVDVIGQKLNGQGPQ